MDGLGREGRRWEVEVVYVEEGIGRGGSGRRGKK